ncbi:helix-turn-helix transcriptional regulator [Nonomuraea lactucae]|uniref:helix-turn-helix transcriptional regulator n=1 Tax=Nonomuraea lactucae TaxID=2249762 RepID=UPI0013B39148|nr:LuxR C-terminal-related transcriptional regulator [Nonomuraea lactucae]
MSLSIEDYRRLLELVTVTLENTEPNFPGNGVTSRIRELFGAEIVGAGTIDLVGPGSRRWATSPSPVPLDGSAGFHQIAIDHPLTRAYRNSQRAAPLRLSDVEGTATDYTSLYRRWLGAGKPRILTIPLTVTPKRVTSVAVMRSGPDFTDRSMCLARHLQPVLAGVYALRNCTPRPPIESPDHLDEDIGIRLTARELTVLDLLAGGLISTAIARRLGISPTTVEKHIQNIYRKLDTHDRISTVLRAQSIGVLPPTARPATRPPPAVNKRVVKPPPPT